MPEAAEAPPQERREDEGFMAKYGGTILRVLIMYMAMQYFMGQFSRHYKLLFMLASH